MLTKKLGTGFITTAMKKNKCPEEVAKETIDNMACLNMVASNAAKQFQANTVTDITGFGLAVHACEMAQASDVTLQIDLNQLQILPNALKLAKQGFVTRANKTNRQYSKSQLEIGSSANVDLLEIMFDPQTSGGLLISLSQENAEGLMKEIASHPKQLARIIGSVSGRSDHALQVV